MCNVFWFILTTGLLSLSASARTYTTNFPRTENPISEGGMWINGGTVGLDWNNVQTTPGFVGGVGPSSVKYSDPTAILAGNWGPTQTVTATVYSVGASNSYYQEVELRLRTSISAHSTTGYEILFRTPNNSRAYVQIVRWNGPLASFTYLGGRCSYPAVCGGVSGIGVANGDVVKATIVGSMINAYINDVLIATATDTTFATGSPGVGFNYGCGSTYSAFGFTSFTATDDSRTSPSQQRRPDSHGGNECRLHHDCGARAGPSRPALGLNVIPLCQVVLRVNPWDLLQDEAQSVARATVKRISQACRPCGKRFRFSHGPERLGSFSIQRPSRPSRWSVFGAPVSE